MIPPRLAARAILRRAADDERGAALATVLGVSIVLLILIAIGASYTLSGMRKTATDADGSGALAAAYAGADEFTSRLSNDARYARFGNPTSPFTIATGSASRVTLPTGADTNPAFEVGAGGSWGMVDGSNGRASFRYEVDNADFDRTGVIRVRSTGKVGNETRSIIVSIKQKGFIDYLYFTDLESSDPLIKPACNTSYQYNSPHPSGCWIQFGSSDWLHGPVHSNDRIQVCGAKFDEGVTTADPGNPNWTKPSGCSPNPTWSGGAPVSVGALPMPPTNTALANEARADLPDTVPRPGCMYTGPTRIVFNTNGTVNIKSPLTKFTQPAATIAGSRNPVGCGTPGTATGALASPGGATLRTDQEPLDHNLIWVQGVPTNTSDPNYRATPTPTTPANQLPDTFKCLAAVGANTANGSSRPATSEQPAGWTFGSGTNLIRYPLQFEKIPTTESSTAPSYGCANGDVYVEGTMTGAITIAAANFVYVTGNLQYKDSDVDMLGLIGQNAVWLWDPITCNSVTRTQNPNQGTFPGTSGCGKSTTPNNRRIDAAILSVAHTFIVQSYDTGNRGTLTINGTIAQRFRGPVGVSGSPGAGYDKDYWYDDRFRNIAPPKFLTPTSTTYGVTQYASTAPAFSANGAPR